MARHYTRGEVIRARGIRCRVDTHVTDADIVPGGDPDLEVVIAVAMEELPGVHPVGSPLYLMVDEIEDEQEVAA